MEAINLTIQTIGDSIGITIPTQFAVFIEKHAKDYIKSFVKRAYAFSQTSKSFSLQKVHIEMALESQCEQPILGYDILPEYSTNHVSVDNIDLYGALEKRKELNNNNFIFNEKSDFKMKYRCQWTLVEGIYTGNLYQRPNIEANKSIRQVERSISVPSVHQKSSYEHYQDKIVFANDVLCREYQKFFLSIVNLLRYDSVFSIENALNKIVDENKLQPIVPYFIQFIFGKITINLDKPKEMIVLMRFALALGLNNSIYLGMYVHSFLKIAFTGLLSLSFNDSSGEFDVSIRDYSAELLGVICNRCHYYFKDMKIVIFNSLVNALFDTKLTLNSHYGALVGIMSLGDEFSKRLIPHLNSYLHIVKREERRFYSNTISHEIESKIEQIRQTLQKPIHFYNRIN